MKLIIDKGNTRTKIAVFKEDTIYSLTVVNHLEVNFIQEILSKYDVHTTIFSTVSGEENKEVMDYLAENTQLFIMSEDLSLPIKINYLPKYSLGNDRIAAIVGGYQKFPNQSVLVIDAGTCICMDFVNNRAEYKGGSISLGFQIKTKALNNFTASLPLVDLDYNIPLLCSNNTIDCIKSGIVNGTIAEIQGMIDLYKKQEKENGFQTILTGGDAKFISEQLCTNHIVEENLVLEGLNTILEYNIKNRDV